MRLNDLRVPRIAVNSPADLGQGKTRGLCIGWIKLRIGLNVIPVRLRNGSHTQRMRCARTRKSHVHLIGALAQPGNDQRKAHKQES
jgi:hypothetical protein